MLLDLGSWKKILCSSLGQYESETTQTLQFMNKFIWQERDWIKNGTEEFASKRKGRVSTMIKSDVFECRVNKDRLVIVNLHFQFDWIQDYLGDKPLGISARASSKRLNWEGKPCEWHHPLGWSPTLSENGKRRKWAEQRIHLSLSPDCEYTVSRSLTLMTSPLETGPLMCLSHHGETYSQAVRQKKPFYPQVLSC